MNTTAQSPDLVDSTKIKIIRVAAICFTNKGYNGTSLDEIAKICKIKKQSIFYYFSNKQSLALSVITYCHQYCRDNIFSILNDKGISNKQRCEIFLDAIHQQFDEKLELHSVCNIARELMGTQSEFQAPINRYYEDWLQAIEEVIIPFHTKAASANVAKISLSQLYGAYSMAHILSDGNYIKQTKTSLLRWWVAGEQSKMS